MFALAWHYLTGRSVSTSPTNRLLPEWPPHPDRVFQALVAAWGEGDADAAGEAALRWLEELPPPQIAVPAAESVSEGASPKVFVPVNDITGPKRGEYNDKAIALLPSQRRRSERYFPSTHVGHATCALIWPDADPAEHQIALTRLCAQVVRIGHSRSLVRMWMTDESSAAALMPSFVPSTGTRRSCMLRCAGAGRLTGLLAAFTAGQRPDTAPWIGYAEPIQVSHYHGSFTAQLTVLRRMGGDRLFLPQTAMWTDALRGTLIAAADNDPTIKSLVSGHAADGQALQHAHAAYLPLAFIGDGHADGHLLGLGIALPWDLETKDEYGFYTALAACMKADDHGRQIMTLRAGRAGVAHFMIEDRPAPAKALSSKTWCTSAHRWSTVTPIVLDRQPPRRHADHDAFAAEEIARSCSRQGLPQPVEIAVLPVSACRGAPPTKAFPPLPRRGDAGRRWHTHAVLTFSEKVSGPLILGAGRYRGYGLCRPGDVR